MGGESLVERLERKFPGAVAESDLAAVDPWVGVVPERFLEVCRWLKSEADLAFDYLNCITAVDYFAADPKKAKGLEPRIEVVYHLSSIRHKHSLVLKVRLPRWQGDQEGVLPEVPSVVGIWRTADWHERETYDLSGIDFVGHPDLRRILCPEDWEGHPLRKDYEMPLEYHGIRGR